MSNLKGFIGFIFMTIGFTYLFDSVPQFIFAWKEAVKENQFSCKHKNSCIKCSKRCKCYGNCEECTAQKCDNCCFSKVDLSELDD